MALYKCCIIIIYYYKGRGGEKGRKGRGHIPSPQNSTQIYAYVRDRY